MIMDWLKEAEAIAVIGCPLCKNGVCRAFYGIGEPCHQVPEDVCKAARKAYEIAKEDSVFLKEGN